MPRIHISLPDDLYRAAVEAGLPVSAICRQALEAELAAHDGDPDRPMGRLSITLGEDDAVRHRHGMMLGRTWAREEATLEEMATVLAWRDHRWRQLPLDPATHSLPSAYCRAGGLLDPEPSQPFWFERNAHTMGMIAGIAEIYDRVVEPAAM